MKTLRLYRGIGLDPDVAEESVRTIKVTGLIGNPERCAWVEPTVGRQIVALHQADPAAVFNALREAPTVGVAYGCGDFEGAARYALRASGHPYVIEFEVRSTDVVIDGRDFLYAMFQFWDRSSISKRDEVRNCISDVFGGIALEYFDLSSKTSDQQARMGFCDQVVFNSNAIDHHYSNRSTISGRYGTVFCSAFQTPAALHKEKVISVKPISAGVTERGSNWTLINLLS
jgi:hypothetical protein